MSELFDTGQFACGDPAALVSYIYGECSDGEREIIAAHLAHCMTCAEEVASLGSTRQQLAAWRPPELALGFQITRAEAAASGKSDAPSAPTAATILPFDYAQGRPFDSAQGRPFDSAQGTRARWWNQPLPAWAQMAAAVLIFGAGLALGTTRDTTRTAPVTTAAVPVAGRPSAVSATASNVSHEELARLEQQLRSEMAQLRTAGPATRTTAAVDDQAVMQRVNRLIAASEERQQRELAFRTAQIVNDFANARKIDLMQIDQRLNNFERATGRRVETNQLDIRSLAQTVGYTLK